MTQALALPPEKTADRRPHLRVVHLVSTLNIGGLEKVVFDLTRLANRELFDVQVICLGEIGALGPDFIDQGIRVESLEGGGVGTRKLTLRLAKRLRQIQAHVLHTHNPAPHLVGALARRLSGIPVLVHTKHGRNYPERRRKVWANRLATYLTDCVVAVSQNAADVARDVEQVPERKLRIIRNGIDLVRFPLGVSPSRIVKGRVIHVARLIYPTKDQITLLRAARLVADVEPAFSLHLVGDGPHRAMLQALCDELNLREHVTFHGFRGDVVQLLGEAELFVLSSVKEGLSITLLEAMASGLPVVATAVGGNPEVVAQGETGLLAPARNPEALASAMLELLADPVRARRMGIAGRERVEQEFDLRRVVAKYEELYVSLLERRCPDAIRAAVR